MKLPIKLLWKDNSTPPLPLFKKVGRTMPPFFGMPERMTLFVPRHHSGAFPWRRAGATPSLRTRRTKRQWSQRIRPLRVAASARTRTISSAGIAWPIRRSCNWPDSLKTWPLLSTATRRSLSASTTQMASTLVSLWHAMGNVSLNGGETWSC